MYTTIQTRYFIEWRGAATQKSAQKNGVRMNLGEFFDLIK